jgi:alcohol dehydrogenase (cytochrome c)
VRILSFALAAALAAAPLMRAQVRYEDILAGLGDDWLTFMGDYSANRHSPLDQITADNVKNLVPKWFFHISGARRVGSYPVVYDGLMYVTNSNEVYALDAVSGREVWHYRQEGVEMQRQNRGPAILGDRVFFVTSDCHLVALNRHNGGVIWDALYAEPDQGYHCTVAPVAVKDKIIVGVSGGDSGIRGFLEARSAEDGSQAWRLWTIPAKGEPGSEGWGPKTLDWGGAGTWMPGAYDPELNWLIWPTGNPWPDFYGGDRPGDNLYTDCLIAVDLDTGEMKWYFQFTPHDVWDWDAQEPPLLLDLDVKGQKRKVVVQANRNGFYYILDRKTGEFLHASPFVDKLTWASGVDAKGRPILVPGMEPNAVGVEVCPTVRGAANWMSDSYNPDTGLMYVMTLEACDVYTSSAKEPEPKVGFAGTGGENPPGRTGRFVLRALKPENGERVWEYPLTGPTTAWAGTVSTAGGLVFFGDDDNHLAAVDAKDGKHLWHFNLGQPVYASPITWARGGKQYVTIVAQAGVFTFGLFEPVQSTPFVDKGREP